MGRAVHADPIAYPPRGMSRDEAARYVGVSATRFDEMIRAGHMPGPKRVGTRTVWDRFALDQAFTALPDGNGEDFFDNLFDKARAAR